MLMGCSGIPLLENKKASWFRGVLAFGFLVPGFLVFDFLVFDVLASEFIGFKVSKIQKSFDVFPFQKPFDVVHITKFPFHIV